MSKTMTLHECEELAQDDGYNTATFDLVGPTGRKKCKWLDAYMGLFQMEGLDGFLMTSQFRGQPVVCENFKPA